MKTKLIVALLVAVSASAVAPAFASGYGPAPAYKDSIGAPASQRGQSVQTLGAERDAATDSQAAYGGVAQDRTGAGSRAAVTPGDNLYSHR
jgi:hypothetical protein